MELVTLQVPQWVLISFFVVPLVALIITSVLLILSLAILWEDHKDPRSTTDVRFVVLATVAASLTVGLGFLVFTFAPFTWSSTELVLPRITLFTAWLALVCIATLGLLSAVSIILDLLNTVGRLTRDRASDAFSVLGIIAGSLTFLWFSFWIAPWKL